MAVRSPLTAYLIALATLVVAVLIRLALDPLMGDSLPLVTLFGAVAVAVWVGGYRPAILVSLLGYLACAYLFIPPRGALSLDQLTNIIGLLAYLFTCLLIVGLGHAMRSAQRMASDRTEVYRVTLRSIGDAVIATDNAGTINYVNGVAEKLTGWSLREAMGRPLEDVFRIVNEETRQPVESPATRALRDGVVVGLANHTVLVRKDNSECPIDDSAAPIKDERGKESGCVLIFRDASAQRQIERERIQQLVTARTLASIIETSEDAIVSKSLKGIIQSWNQSAERLFGYTEEEAVGQHISLVIPPDRLSEEDEIIANLSAGKRVEHYETERVRKDGSRVIVSLAISPILDDSGMVIGASKIVRDITRQRQAEADREKLTALIERSPDFIAISDLEGIPLYINKAGMDMIGLSGMEEASKVLVTDCFFPEDQSRITNEFFPSVLKTGHGEIEVRFRHFKTGKATWMAYKVFTLKDAFGRPNAYATVSQDLTQRKKLEQHLRTMAEDLSDAARRKDEFLAILAHELRNPLAPISNAVQVLRMRGNHDGQAVDAASDMLQRQVAQMARLVDDLLDVSRITRGKIELRRERMDLRKSINQAVEATSAQYKSMNHQLTVSTPLEPIYVDADGTRLAQVIGNLLNNACKFTDKGGHIKLTVEKEDHEAVIKVRDNGIGIDSEHLPNLFQMFSQIDTSLERSRDGLGIGLTLVKNIVELHEGRVEVRSEGLGKGSEFTVRIPTVAEDATTLAPSAANDGASAPGINGGSGRRILIVDDNEDGAQSLSMLLQLNGHDTFIARDGFEALDMVESLKPDTVLLDIGLPRMNGYEVCKRARQLPGGERLHLIALTGWGQDDDRLRSREAGFDEHMVKPVDHLALLQLLKTFSAQTR